VSREQPAAATPEVIASDIVLAVHQGAISVGGLLPSARELADGYDVPLTTARAALGRLERIQIARAGHDGKPTAGDVPPQGLLLAAASACRLLTQPPADPTAAKAWRRHVSPVAGELQVLGEAFARETRRAPGAPLDADTLEKARKVLASVGTLLEGAAFPWTASPGAGREP
jgi:DNA-binding transcriptional MocR family regulator